jgi:outer membrane protein OmpA-like peptidoglycan-associated protein
MNGDTSPASADVVRCPVCTHGSMVEGGTSCASCGSDLAVLARLARVRRVVTASPAATVPVPEPRKRSWAPAAWLIVGVVVGGAVGAALPGRSRAADVLPVARTEPVPLAKPDATAPPSSSAAADPTASRTLDDLAARLSSLSDVVSERRGDRLLLTARSELFGRSMARLRPSETALLRRIASALFEGSAPLRIHVRGHTDASPTRARGTWANNWALGMSRAQAVALALDRHRSGEADQNIIEVSSGAADTPEIGGESGPRRTVVLLVSTVGR